MGGAYSEQKRPIVAEDVRTGRSKQDGMAQAERLLLEYVRTVLVDSDVRDRGNDDHFGESGITAQFDSSGIKGNELMMREERPLGA